MGTRVGHWAAWQAARVEVTQKQEQDRRQGEYPLEKKVVDEIVDQTDLEREAATA